MVVVVAAAAVAWNITVMTTTSTFLLDIAAASAGYLGILQDIFE